MSEFDLDPQIRGAAGFGWAAHLPSTADGSDTTEPVDSGDPVTAAYQGYQRLT